jgi:hypothetical protein
VPLTQPGTPYERLAVALAVDRLLVAIAAIMRKATAPELCKSAATLTPKWEKLRQNPGEAALKPPQLTWPEVRSQLEPEGKGVSMQNRFVFMEVCCCFMPPYHVTKRTLIRTVLSQKYVKKLYYRP